MPSLVVIPLVWVGAAAFWWLLAGNLGTSELVGGGVASVVATVAAAVVRKSELASFEPRLRWLLGAPRIAVDVALGLWVLVKALRDRVARRPSKALFQAVGFDAGGDDAESAARRALVVMLTTLPPNFVVLGVDREHDVLVVHQVEKSPPPAVAKMLGARE